MAGMATPLGTTPLEPDAYQRRDRRATDGRLLNRFPIRRTVS